MMTRPDDVAAATKALSIADVPAPMVDVDDETDPDEPAPAAVPAAVPAPAVEPAPTLTAKMLQELKTILGSDVGAFEEIQKIVSRKRKAPGDDDDGVQHVEKSHANGRLFLDFLEMHKAGRMNEDTLFACVTEEMNKQFCVIRGEGSFFMVDLCGKTAEGESVYHIHTIESLKKHMTKFTMKLSKKISYNPVDIWSKHINCREYKFLEFDPQMTLDQTETLNLFTGLRIPRSRATKGNVQPMLDHINTIICRRNPKAFKYFISWLAHLIQFPGKKMDAALVITGKQGTGKTVIFELMEQIIGSKHYFLTDSFGAVDGSFQPDSLITNLLLIYDECTKTNNKAQEEKAKSRVTGKKLSHNKKYHDALQVRNCQNLVFCSNGRSVNIEGQDRRYPCFVTDPKYSGDHNDPETIKYFARVRSVQPEHFAHFLYNWDLSKFNPRVLPSSDHRRREKLLSVDRVFTWIHYWLSNPNSKVEGVRTPTELHNAYKTFLKDNFKKMEPLVKKDFLLHLREMFPFARAVHCVPEPGQAKATIIRFPSVAECKDLFQKHFCETEWEWENLEDDEPTAAAAAADPFTTFVEDNTAKPAAAATATMTVVATNTNTNTTAVDEPQWVEENPDSIFDDI